jgi:nucleotide-binding universal stress UspA family protein
MAKLLGQFSRNTRDLNIGYIVTGNESYLYTAFDVPEEERFTAYPKKLILNDLKSAKVRVKPGGIHVLHHRTFSTTTAVDHLLSFAKSKRADMLALFTHNKRGLERLIMGSFAETAVHRSRIDLLLAGPRTKYPARIRSIFYASDFSPGAKKDLRHVLGICKRTRARLTVFHAAQITYRWSLDESNPEIHAYRRKTKKMSEWIESESKKARVPCSVMLKAEFEPIPDLAFEAARRAKADLFIVSAKVGPFAALMGGSVTRNIIRHGTYPVMVLKR